MVTPNDFKRAFCEAVRKYEVGAESVAYWRSCGFEMDAPDVSPLRKALTTREFTELIRRNVVPLVAHILGTKVRCERGVRRDDRSRGRLDAIFFEQDQEVPVIAWEHEGHIPGSVREVGNLRSVDAPLKVLVTYLRPRTRRPDCAEEWLNLYAAEYERSRGDKSPAGSFMVIFGIPNGDWEFYVYSDGRFREIPD